MKKVLILTRAFDGGGTETAMLSLVQALIKEEYQVKIMCIRKAGVLLEKFPKEICIEEIPFQNEFYRFVVNGKRVPTSSIKIAVFKLLKKIYMKRYPENGDKNMLYHKILKYTDCITEEFDLALDFYGYGGFATAYLAEKIAAKRKAVWIHDENIHWIGKISEYFLHFQRIYCVSNAVKSAFVSQCPRYAEKAETFYNLTDIERIRERGREPLSDSVYVGKFKILTVGRLVDQKGYDYAIEAARILRERQFEFTWFVIGDGEDKNQLKRMVDAYNLKSSFIFLGRKENPLPYMKNCDLYVQPSRSEGYSTTVLEAKALQCIILVSDIPSNRELIKDGENGFLCKLNAESIADRICEIKRNSELIKSVQKNLSLEEMDFSSEVKKLEQLLKAE
ncbi:glycosyltransferase [Mediterraneibacter agrestimuris]|uniref:glycosyltransferase n=1 Tax=Mediterraneibacter agrestimuris TaxID=2941333 RepID=UPI00203E444A|nr:glycosyltransferase [Mediterraneibacter agrestimuris]